MNKIMNFKEALNEKRAVKIIAGMMNFNMENVRNVVSAAVSGGAHAVDICFNKEIFDMTKEMTKSTNVSVFVSSVVPEELAMAAQWGADAIELGNFDALYREGRRFSAHDVLNLVVETQRLLNGKDVFFSVTVPGHISVAEQIELARKLENMNVDLIQTEGSAMVDTQKAGALGLLETSQISIANTMELTSNIELPVMTASGISVKTAPLAFAAGASAIGVGSAVNRCENVISMIATVKSLVESTGRVSRREILHV